MYGPEPTSATVVGVREQRRQTHRLLQRRKRARRRMERGQTLIIFALSITALLGIAGLTIDVGRAYDLYARMQRAAEAGALAGVIYLPNHYNTLRKGDTESAIRRASEEVVKNGFGSVLAYNANACSGTQEVQVCQVLDTDTALEVIITERMNVVFLSGLGVQPITLVAKGQAEYDPPVGLTSRQAYIGDAMECSPSNSQNTNSFACDIGDTSQPDHLQYDVAAFDGPAELKEWGDPYVYCAEGPEQLSPAGPNPSNGNGFTTYNGLATNHAQWSDVANGSPIGPKYCGPPGPNPGNPDQQPFGFEGPVTKGTAHPMGYNYIVNVNTTGDNSLWIYNPGFVAQDLTTSPAHPLTLDHFLDPSVIGPLMPAGSRPPADPGYYAGPNGEGIGNNYDGVHHDAPLFYFTVTYSIFQVNNVLDRSSDGDLIAQEVFQPYDATSADLSFEGCTAGQVYDPLWQGPNTPNWYHLKNQVGGGQGCVTLQSSDPTAANFGCVMQWCPFTNNVACGTCIPVGQAVDPSNNIYRLVIEATGLTANGQNNGVTDYNSGPQDGYGQHGYGMKLCVGVPPALTSPVPCDDGSGKGAGGFNVPPLNITGWNNSTINLIEPLTTQGVNLNYPNSSCIGNNQYPYSCHDIACIPSVYAGRTINARVFDPGDIGTGDLYIGLIAPPGGKAAIVYPPYVTTTTLNGDTVFKSFEASGGYRPYNGLWVTIQIVLSSKYAGDCKSTGAHSGKSGWFQLVAISPSGAVPNDMVTYRFTVVGSPVHLMPPA